jgi:hypothetical protein
MYIAAEFPAFLLSLKIQVCIFYVGREDKFKCEMPSV